jgi:peptide/nickel transport system substrate-binding protein
MNVPKIVGVFILALLGASILLGCASQMPTSPENASGPTAQSGEIVRDETAAPVGIEEGVPSQDTEDTDTILILIADEVSTLEPYRMVSVHPEGSVASHLWDTLTLLNDDLQVEPHLAESWRLVNNFTWEFKLRQGITFHNGELLDAEAVRFSIERAQSMPGSLETFAEDVGLEQVEIVDDYTLRLTTRQPVANLPYHLAFLEILPPIYYSETSPDQLAVAPVGSGPYRLGQWIRGEALVLEAVPTYWKGAPALSHLIFETVPLAEERLTVLRGGKAALVTDLPPMPVDQWDSPNSRLEAIESTQRMLIGIRIEEGSPLADKRVRQALNYGVNVEQIVDDWLAGYGERYGSWVNPPWNNSELAPWPYDPDLARDLLAEAGYREGFTTTLRTPAGVYYQDVAVAEAVAQQLGEIGVTVEVETVDWATYVGELLSGNVAPLFLLGLNSHGDGLEDVKNLSAAFAFNPTGWRSESFEEILGRALNTFNEDSRARLLNQAQSIAYDEAPWIWLWRQYEFYGVSNELDWAPRADGLIYLRPSIGGLVVSTFTPAPAATSSPTSVPTSTATDTPTNTPTLTVTLAALHTPTSTSTPVPTNTPSPTDTPTSTPYPAPTLVGPEEGTSFPEGEDVKLAWEWERDLAENEFFEVRIRLQGEQEFDPMDLIKVPYRFVFASNLTQAGTYEWQVAIVSLAGEEKGASQIWSFEVR